MDDLAFDLSACFSRIGHDAIAENIIRASNSANRLVGCTKSQKDFAALFYAYAEIWHNGITRDGNAYYGGPYTLTPNFIVDGAAYPFLIEYNSSTKKVVVVFFKTSFRGAVFDATANAIKSNGFSPYFLFKEDRRAIDEAFVDIFSIWHGEDYGSLHSRDIGTCPYSVVG